MSEFKDLIGKKIKQISLNAGKDYLVFQTNQGDFGYYAYGDCCSHSWFEHWDGVQALIGEVVLEIEDKDIPEISDEEHKEKGYDSLRQYGYTFLTTKGRSTLEMRNDSNGYYGGSVEKTEDITLVDTNPIKEDF